MRRTVTSSHVSETSLRQPQRRFAKPWRRHAKLRLPSTWWLWPHGIAFVAQSCLAPSRTYDVTRIFMEELIRHPLAAADDFIEAVSRYIDPLSPVPYDAKSTESIDDSGIDQNAPEGEDGPD